MKVLNPLPVFAGAPQNLLCETILAEIWAYRVVSRSTLIRQVQARLAPWQHFSSEDIQAVLEIFQRQRQIMSGPQGKLAATPLRLIQIEDNAFVMVGGPSSKTLKQYFSLQIEPTYPLRRCVFDSAEGLTHLVAWGAKVLNPETWTGLEDSLPAGQKYLDELDDRLKHESQAVWPLELTWKGYFPHTETTQKQRWGSKQASSQLWRAWYIYGYWIYAWTATGSPAQANSIALKSEDALKACYSLDLLQNCPLSIAVKATGTAYRFRLPGWLPASEFRFLSLYSTENRMGNETVYQIGKKNWPRIKEKLEARLGVKMEETSDGLE